MSSVLSVIKEKTKEAAISDQEFMSKNIMITNKNQNRQRLSLNKTQIDIENKILELQSQGIPPRIVVLKARQQGVTTYVQGKMMAKTAREKDKNCFIVSHEQESTNAIFAKTKFMYENLPDDIKPLQKASNARELIFDTPNNYKGNKTGLHSKIVVKIAGKESIGRGDTPCYVHLSEYAFWKGSGENSPENQLTAIMQAVPDTTDSLVIIESTAKGFNDFKDVWDNAKSGKNGWTPLFFAWFDDIGYSKEFDSKDEKVFFESSLDEYERDIQKRFNLTLEQLNWYRYTKKIKCNNNPDKMKQENPSFPEEAFVFSGIPVFNNNLVMARINELIKIYEKTPPLQGRFSFNPDNKDFSFMPVPASYFEGENVQQIIIYEQPENGYPYVIGADTKGEGKDYYTATVVNNITGDRVATMRLRINNSKPFTEQLYCLGMYYNKALIGVEINFNTAPVEDLKTMGYPKQYIREKRGDLITSEYDKKYGWKTDGNTRPLIIDKEIEFLNENIDCFNDINTLREMLSFAYDNNGRPDAMSGKHDDLLFSDMIAQEIRKKTSTNIKVETEAPIKKLQGELKNIFPKTHRKGGLSRWQKKS
jgi:hypothetical protein